MVIPVRPKRQSAEPDIDLNALRIFVAIAEAGSFVGGGKVMGLTRSAAGKAIARLEANLGARLLHRTTRRVSMTADGLYFYQRCVQILQDLAEAQEGVRQARPPERHTASERAGDLGKGGDPAFSSPHHAGVAGAGY